MPTPNEIHLKKIILSPLDWGLGHTTRCISLIKLFLSNGNEVHIAGNQKQLNYYKNDFQHQLSYHHLDGYDFELNPEKSTYWQLALQSKKLQKKITTEKTWLETLNKTENFDLVVSDNRFGFHLKNVESILISHQLNLQVPFAKSIANKLNLKYINKFNTCWIPDYPDHRLTNELSKNSLAIASCFIGPLNRFERLKAIPLIYDYLFIPSGPEPARSQFINSAIAWSKQNKGKFALLNPNTNDIGNFTSVISHTTEELNELLFKAKKVVARAGYTSIMELSELGIEAILIPTPGQYEQLYLAQSVNISTLTFSDEKTFFS